MEFNDSWQIVVPLVWSWRIQAIGIGDEKSTEMKKFDLLLFILIF